MDRIFIRDLEVCCIIGTMPHERVQGQKVVLNIELECDLRPAGRSDELADTVDYCGIRDELQAALGVSQDQLIERLAQRAATICLAHAPVSAVTITLDKPGALTGARSVAVRIRRERESRSA